VVLNDRRDRQAIDGVEPFSRPSPPAARRRIGKLMLEAPLAPRHAGGRCSLDKAARGWAALATVLRPDCCHAAGGLGSDTAASGIGDGNEARRARRV
jgi:hypothetical protein